MSLKETNNPSPQEKGALKTLLKQIWKNHSVYLDVNTLFDESLINTQKAAIILSTNLDNYERFSALNEFKSLMKSLNLRLDLYSIQYAQVCFINALNFGILDKNELLKALEKLQKITDNALIYAFVSKQKIIQKDYKQEFQNSHQTLDNINQNLQKLCEDEKVQKLLQEALLKFSNIDFSIAVTGVVNAGKSSMLNALLKKEFLGVSNVPETANLSILKYGKEQKAKIYFWNENEWQDIIKSSNDNQDMQELIKQLEQNFNLNEYIKKESKNIQINFDELKNYTSAKNKISALIKKIELFSSLDFLKDNVCIVDTPGLDDVIIQRELLTKAYISKADFLIHLMNASQSLSQKDCDFIIECLLTSRVSKLLIVLTKADLLSEKDLQEVINYTKNKLKENLAQKQLNQELLDNVDFVCISSKLANDFYQKRGGNLEQSNILTLEELIVKSLYDKNKIALSAYKKELLLHLEKIEEKIKFSNKMLNYENIKLDEKNQAIVNDFKAKKEKLMQVKAELSAIFNAKDENAQEILTLLHLLAKKLKEKLIDELKYNQNNKIKNNTQRLNTIIDTTLKDGIFDLLRELKQQSEHRINEIKNTLSVKYDFLKAILEQNCDDFKSKVEAKIESIFTNDLFMTLKAELLKNLESTQDIYKLESSLENQILEKLQTFNIEKIALDFKNNQEFFTNLELSLNLYEKEQEEQIKNLKDLILQIEQNEQNSKELLEKNNAKLQSLKTLKTELLNEK
ncbi:dynamin family protein [Campylobacter lari]|uniref:dynamin family protein n=1 Tax=Campylobacter lari TaxID=201 RepID=UPI00128749F3|nr:dynamin family protein [Campylobacter lari]EAH6292901.1 ATP-binding protein [Campylobacter lari]EAI7870905.1 ATP-binding protein [Campylobacter lari]EAI8652771.1 ATP-binding protein [Campylobacter lari]EAJ5702935.1 ATP-binding protein [Campylobacter lari]EAJ6134993.1 ATP-binding protein [Campylobacter lari]